MAKTQGSGLGVSGSAIRSLNATFPRADARMSCLIGYEARNSTDLRCLR